MAATPRRRENASLCRAIVDDARRRAPLAARVRESPEVSADTIVARAEAAIAALRDDYRESLGPTFRELAGLYRAAAARPGANAAELRALHARAFDMKGPGGTFGYALISRIGELLCAFVSRIEVARGRELALVGAHVDALATVIRDGIEGDGGAVGCALVDSLEQAAAKLHGG